MKILNKEEIKTLETLSIVYDSIQRGILLKEHTDLIIEHIDTQKLILKNIRKILDVKS